MEQEKIDLEKVLVIANNLKQLANDLESILNKNTNDINNLNTKEYYLSPAAAKILDKYLNNITKFNRYKEEIINYANILELKNEAYLKNRDNLKHVFLLIDYRHKPTEDDCLMYEFLKFYNLDITIIATKYDKISKNNRLKQDKLIKDTLKLDEKEEVITFSTITKKGRSEVLSILEKKI